MILQVLAYTLSKISVALFVLTLNVRRDIKLASYILLVAIIAWGTCSVFILAFRCSLPTPWNGSKGECLDAFKIYLGINIVNIITDIALVVIPIVMMWGVHTSFDVKLWVIGLFATRVMCVASHQLRMRLTSKQCPNHDHSSIYILGPARWVRRYDLGHCRAYDLGTDCDEPCYPDCLCSQFERCD